MGVFAQPTKFIKDNFSVSDVRFENVVSALHAFKNLSVALRVACLEAPVNLSTSEFLEGAGFGAWLFAFRAQL